MLCVTLEKERIRKKRERQLDSKVWCGEVKFPIVWFGGVIVREVYAL